MKCESCRKDKKDVRVIIDPYHHDVDDEDIEMALCEQCEQSRRDDI